MKKCPKCRKNKQANKFHRNRNTHDGLAVVCAECHSKVQKESRTRPLVIDRIRRKRLLSRYGITLECFNEMLAVQNGCCAVCPTILVVDGKGCSQNSANVDHDHETGEVRGLLCWSCNRRLGYLETRPDLNAKLLSYSSKNRLKAV
jgi:hypothetical protein